MKLEVLKSVFMRENAPGRITACPQIVPKSSAQDNAW